MSDQASHLRERILALSREYAALVHRQHEPAARQKKTFEPGKTPVPYSGRVFDADEVSAGVGAMLDFWLTLGKEGDAFETELAARLGVRRSLLVNSGSSANLLAISALTSAKLPEERRLRRGDEVITCAAGFPTTVAPIVQNGAVPVFIDNLPQTGNADCAQLEAAFIEGKTKAVIFAHALGNPFDLTQVLAFCRKHGLWLIEDNCDALGSTYSFSPKSAFAESFGVERLTGSFGDLSTQSFYPPHHLTLGEGGAVNLVSNMLLKVCVESFRDWGRDCWCASGADNTCGKRFGWQQGELPLGYDHKYTYSHLGYNLKPLDVQAAIGRVQLKRLDAFGQARRENWQYLRRGLADLEDVFEFSLPTHATSWSADGFGWDQSGAKSDPSWFGFLLLVRPTAGFRHSDLARFLDERKIGNRMFFGGNLVRQPAFVQLRKDQPGAFRVVGSLSGADRIMNEALFLGVYPGLSREMLDYVIESVHAFAALRRE
ncbi:MAG TPA: lipopolysaccharide biosynthesis protein RfbH [Opitutaceae bacterium]|nr:lipopolysaccharide biosynthesis protein RfbH [Opitutaceae bacterium]